MISLDVDPFAEVDGTIIGPDPKVLLMLAAANRDPRAWPRADAFDITRWAARVARMVPDGARELAINNTLRGWATLPVRLEAA